MKTLKLASVIALMFTFMAVVQCSDKSSTVAPSLFDLTGIVNYPNSSGAATPAVKATVTLLTPASTVLVTLTDDTGKYTFANLENGAYSLSASYFALPTHTGGRLDGLNFETAADASITIASADIAQNLELTSTGQSGTSIEAIDLNYTWSGTAYVNSGTWTYDGSHSPVAFEFPYRGQEADFVGAFSQLSKMIVNFDPASPATGTIDVEVDMMSVNTRALGGRDPLTGNPPAANPVFSPNTLFSTMGCISGTFGVTADGALPSVIVNDNADRYAQFKVLAGGISKYGDGFIAKGNITWRGFTIATEMWFKVVPKWQDAPSAGNGTTNNRFYSGFEGKFLLDPYNKYNIRSGSVNEAILRIQISIVAYKL
jgi:hypothetical protein